ncbi:NADPH:quinone reductase [Frigoriglobus tundricola]|uniref:Zinc-type alcohol dehydrogenase-like protein n=1 Tax=Frigoriglobus tundricola TaxID=2774151 RepID=A0A6M5YIU8_9BACT|nr:NADPH:quinone reductase [Frigoriglobus tundricola]QJW93173.1 Zinc-type alcohol dehydrogenase-like protein [Frigoriglobus tundricola]
MKAAFFDTTGAPDVIRVGDLQTPEPKGDEVRVRVLAASINPIDTYIRSGAAPMPLPKPAITGTDFAGVVDAVGPDVKYFRAGDRVWGSNQGLLGRQGTCAEFVCVEEKWAYHTPNGVADDQAAACALVGITAHLGLFQRAKLTQRLPDMGRQETVFVNGGTGGVGSMVVQMAKAAGTKVICTVGSDEKARLATELGADCVVNYKTDDVAARVKDATAGAGIDVWFETVPPTDFDRTVDLMAPRGRIVVMAGRAARPVLPNGPFYVKGLSLVGFAMFNMTAGEQVACAENINRWLSEGKLRALIGARFPLARTADAHTLQEENTLRKSGTLTGKIVILPAA